MRSTFFVKKVEPKSFTRIYFEDGHIEKYYLLVEYCWYFLM